MKTKGVNGIGSQASQKSNAGKNKQTINPVDQGHIAFRTDNIKLFIERLTEKGIPFSDYGTTFAKEWHQVFFHDPEGNVIEVHQNIK